MPLPPQPTQPSPDLIIDKGVAHLLRLSFWDVRILGREGDLDVFWQYHIAQGRIRPGLYYYSVSSVLAQMTVAQLADPDLEQKIRRAVAHYGGCLSPGWTLP